MNDPIDQFRQAIESSGLTPPNVIHDDGAIHRFSTNGKPTHKNGWYMLHTDGIAAGVFGDWREGLQSTWCAKSDTTMTQAERDTHRQRIKAMQAQREAEQAQRQQSAATEAAQRLAAATACTQHAYLTVKGVQGHGVKVDSTGALIVPMRDTAGKLHSLQTVSQDGDKRFLFGGLVKGCYHAIGKPDGVLIVCEGYATGASIHECTGHAVAVAFNAGNLEAVAVALRAKYAALKIIIAADDDHLTDGNPGMSKATAAARAVGGLVAVPSFPANRPDKDTDFNDLHKSSGADVVKTCIDAAIKSVASGKIPNEAADDELPDNHRNAPRPDPSCLYGLVGDVARAGGDTTEANPFAVAANIIAFMSCAIGRGPYMAVGNTWHHVLQFMLHIGRSGRGRKGDAVSLISRIVRALMALSQDATPQVHRGGLSSREGLVFLIHDGYTEGKTEVEAILDKRLLVIESEFANILHQGKREGNTLSAALRDCWDGVSMKPATKSSRLWATDPHIAMIGAITPGELLGLMASRELTNGFANRFMMFWAERTKMLAFPRATRQEDVDALAVRVHEVLKFCKAERWAEKDHMRVELSPDARKRYEKLYHGELNDNSAGERITALIERRAPMLLRLAMLFALCDLTATVEVHHINAALAWVRYSVESVKFIFASAADEVAVAETNDTAQKIINYLTEAKKATRKDLTASCFQGHTSKSRIDSALDELLSSNPPRIKVESIPRPKGSPGSATKIYQLNGANSANSANSEYPRGLADVFTESELCEPCELSPTTIATVSTVSTVSNPENQAQIYVNADSSHSSHSSHADLETDALCEGEL